MDKCKHYTPASPGVASPCGRTATRWWRRDRPLAGTVYIVARCDEHAGMVDAASEEMTRSEAVVLDVMRS